MCFLLIYDQQEIILCIEVAIHACMHAKPCVRTDAMQAEPKVPSAVGHLAGVHPATVQ